MSFAGKSGYRRGLPASCGLISDGNPGARRGSSTCSKKSRMSFKESLPHWGREGGERTLGMQLCIGGNTSYRYSDCKFQGFYRKAINPGNGRPLPTLGP